MGVSGNPDRGMDDTTKTLPRKVISVKTTLATVTKIIPIKKAMYALPFVTVVVPLGLI
jgi:hypothetical protein